MKKRKDECLFCTSRSCYHRIVRLERPCYDEIACIVHITDGEKHSDATLGKGNGIFRSYISGNSKKRRGDKF